MVLGLTRLKEMRVMKTQKLTKQEIYMGLQQLCPLSPYLWLLSSLYLGPPPPANGYITACLRES